LRVDAAVVAAIDVGKVANVGWWRAGTTQVGGGCDLDRLCDLLADDLAGGCRVALGFEAPLWVPFAKSVDDLGRGRPREGNRAWSAAAGAAVLACVLQQSVYVLDRIARASPRTEGTLDPQKWLSGDAALLVWEGFVSGDAKDRAAPEPHIDDAHSAVTEFESRRSANSWSSDLGGREAVSIAGLALVVARLTTDLSVLSTPAMVVKAPRREHRSTSGG
jgi:hypothetical protein